MTRVVILGTGGNCIDILDTLEDINRTSRRRRYDCVAFLDDDPARIGTQIHGVPVRGRLEEAAEMPGCRFVNGIGSSSNFWRKKDIIARAGVSLDRFETVVHPSASVSRLSRLGPGTVVFQNATITSNATVGSHVIILPSAVISHDDVIGDYTCITGGVCISGCVRIGASCYLGSNSVIRDRVTIGERCLVGMGAVVVADVPPDSVVVGNPARFLRHTSRETPASDGPGPQEG